jgi:hypothetical protein
MTMTKAQRRRETMARFTQKVEEAKRQLAARNLSVRELIEQFYCGDFPTELAAAQLVYERNKDDVMGDVLAGLNHPEWKVRRTCADFLPLGRPTLRRTAATRSPRSARKRPPTRPALADLPAMQGVSAGGRFHTASGGNGVDRPHRAGTPHRDQCPRQLRSGYARGGRLNTHRGY